MVTLVADGRYGVSETQDVSSDPATHPGSPRTAALTTGGFAMVWTDELQRVFVRMFDDNGDPTGPERGLGVVRSFPQVVGLRDGGFAVAWNSPPGVNPPATEVQTFDASGEAAGAPVDVASGWSYLRQMAATSEGGFVISWQDRDGVRLTGFDGGGAAITEPTAIGPANTSLSIATLADSRVLAARFDYNVAPQDQLIAIHTYGLDGELSASPIATITASAGYQLYSQFVTPLANGNFLLTWTERQEGTETVFSTHFETYRADGTATGDHFARSGDGKTYVVSAAALPDGGFVLINSYRLSNYEAEFSLQTFDAFAQPVGDEFGRTPQAVVEAAFPTVVTFGTGDFAVAWTSASFTAPKNTWESPFRVYHNTTIGTDAGDTLTGTATLDILQGLEGADVLLGLAGDDFLIGGAGADLLDGGEGNDTADYRDAAAGIAVNLASGGTGGEAGGDTFVSIENVIGSAFADVLAGDAGANALDGGAGVDAVDYTASAAGVTVNLATGAASGGDAEGDTIANIENIRGSAFADVLTGNIVRNLLEGLGGDDVLAGGANGDTLDGGEGTDTATYAASANGVMVDLAAGTGRRGDAENDVLVSIENVIGSARGDFLTGDAGDNVLTGGVGADALDGGAGLDIASYEGSTAAVTIDLVAGTGTGGEAQGDTLVRIEGVRGSAFKDSFVDAAGASRYDGMAGDDTLSYAGSAAGVTVNLTTGIGSGGSAEGDRLVSIERLVGSAFGDVLTGTAGNNLLDGGAGDDLLIGGGGADDLVGGGGVDRVSYAGSATGVTVSLVAGSGSSGDAAGDRLSGIEELVGSDFADRLMGDAGANALYGGAGDDVLIGGAGDDLLDGGAGYETLSYAVLSRGGAVTRGAGTEVRIAAGGAVGTDTLRGIDDIVMRDGLLSFDENDAWAQVVRIYDTALQRLPDDAGLDFHTGRIASGQTNLLGVATDFLNSAEFQAATGSLNNEQFVRYIYQTALDREPDAGGLSYWTGQLAAGTSRASMLVLFSESAEHRVLTASSLDQGYFTTDVNYQNAALLYDTGLGRLPDAGGIVFWGDALKGGQQSIGSMAAAMAGSGEFQTRTAGFSNAQLVDYMYQNTLDRQGDAGGRAYWTAQLDAGLSKADLIQNFAFSAEHRTLLAPFIDHGIAVI